jgi:quinol monooxygenase YgiN
MAQSRIRVVAGFAVKAEHVDDFIEAARRTMVEPTLQEPGCITYDLCQDVADPTRFAMVEEWESDEALATHLAQAALQDAVKALMPMAAEPPTIQRLRSVTPAD